MSCDNGAGQLLLSPGLHDGDELLFQFGKKTGWPLAEQIGTITPHQVWVASSKTERADYDAAKVRLMACAVIST